MTDWVAVVEYGSHTLRAGLAYTFPSDQEPRLVCASYWLTGSSRTLPVFALHPLDLG